LKKLPCLFISGTLDIVVPHKQTVQVYEKYPGRKEMKAFIGGHNGSRHD